MLNILRDNYTRPLDPHTGKSLINHSWGELLYHTNRYMRRGTLAENYAIGKLQQRIVSQVLILFKTLYRSFVFLNQYQTIFFK